MRQSGAHENLVACQVGQAGPHQTNQRPNKESDMLELADDKTLFKLMCYLHPTPHLSLKSWNGDPFESLSLNLYTDTDHASETEHSKSTSGMVLVLQHDLTTEAEVISLDAGLFGEALSVQELCEILANKPIDLTCHQANSAVIAIAHSGYSPKLRHLSKTHKINLGSLYEVLQDDHVQLRHIATKQLANIFTSEMAGCLEHAAYAVPSFPARRKGELKNTEQYACLTGRDANDAPSPSLTRHVQSVAFMWHT